MHRSAHSSSIDWHELAPFGIEVNTDLREPFGADDRELFRELFFRQGLVVVRGQKLAIEEQIRAVEYILPVERFADNVTYISTDPDVGHLGEQPLPFHSDLLYTEFPRRVSSLHAVEVRDRESYTAFTSGIRAYAELTPDLRAELTGVIGVHVLADYLTPGKRAFGGEIRPDSTHARHPLVLEHPVSGSPILLATETDTVAFEGMARERMSELAEKLFEVLYRPDAIYEHWWNTGDIVIWDNLALQHARGSCAAVGRRTLQLVASQPKALSELDRRLDVTDPEMKEFFDKSFTHAVDDTSLN